MTLLDFPTGSVTPFASAFGIFPAGWVKCNGDLYDYSLDRYAPLYAVIGTTYGSGSGTGFRVPNLGQRIVRGGIPGNWKGATEHQLTHNESGIRSHNHDVTETAHTHTITDPGHYHDQYINATNIQFKTGATKPEASGPNDDDGTTTANSGLGGGYTGDNYGTNDNSTSSAPSPSLGTKASAHENRMPYLVMQYLIKL